MDAQAPAFDDFIDTANVADMSDDHQQQQSQQPQPSNSQQPHHQSNAQHMAAQLSGSRGAAAGPRGPPLMPLSLSALPPHMGGGMSSPFSARPMGSPAGQEHFELPPGMSTPRASNSTLHNINFDFYDGSSPSPMLTSMSPMPDGAHAPAAVVVPQQPGGMVWPTGMAAAPTTAPFAPGPFAPALVPMPTLDAAFQPRPIKLEQTDVAMPMEHMATESSPSTDDRNTSPVSTAPTSLEMGSPPSEKKRRLTSPTANGSIAAPSKGSAASPPATTKKGTKRKPAANKGDDDDDGDSATPAKPAAPKRNPPSASQITESGQPFPVIDTSAKHSSLFVPPDTSGLTKREARLVKNRAAAFLSRQRKREQFEELETKCRSMCRLIWRMWEIIAGPDSSFEAFESTVLALVLRDEAPDVAEVLQQIVGVKGASIAPTEDGSPPTADPSTRTTTPAPAASVASQHQQPQQRPTTSDGPQRAPDGGFPVPGRERSDSSITAMSAPSIAPIHPANAAAAQAELTHLRNQLFAAQQRETALQMELAEERARRNGPEAHDLLEQRRPFRPGAPASQDLGLSLTMPPHARASGGRPGSHHGRTPSLDAPLALPGAFYHDDDLSPTVGRGSGSWESSPTVESGSFAGAKPNGGSTAGLGFFDSRDASMFGPAYAFAHDVHNDVNGVSRSSGPQQHAIAQTAGSMGPKRAAGGMALMAMIFTFAFFGMPNGPAGPGGITRAPGAEALSLGRVLGPVTSSDLRFAARKPRSVRDGSPSSHLSAQDLSIADLLGDTHIKDPSEADAEDDYSQLMDSTEDFMDAEAGGADDDGDDSSAALQRVFGSSMDLGWLSSAAGAQGKHSVDVERGFILIGDPDAKDDGDVTIDAAATKPRRGKKAAGGTNKAAASKGDAIDADNDGSRDQSSTPTKLTLFVPAPSDSLRSPGGDAAIDAWLSAQSGSAEPAQGDAAIAASRPKSNSVSSSSSLSSTATRSISVSASRTETLENASRAALEVLRNHRLAAAQAAAVARAKAGDEAVAAAADGVAAKKPMPSRRAGSAPRSDDGHGAVSPRGRDFLQLEFSLSGARVRNGRELIELLTTAASRAAH